MQPDVIWKEINGVSIPIPPKAHPRLYLRAQHVADLKTRMTDPALKNVWNDLIKLQDVNSSNAPAIKDYKYYFEARGINTIVELKAMDYLVSKDKKIGREAISLILDSLEQAHFPEISDISRGIGRLMVSGSIVYDWCYDLLEPQEKTRFVNAFVRLAKTLECGYPPTKDHSVVGHPSEYMIMRDLLSTGIAIYDEFPEMYHLMAGVFFTQHLPARNWFYPAHAYHQGMSYLNIRYASDLFALWILDRMGAGNVYNPAQQFTLYEMIYKRRPDGQVLAGGDVNYTRSRKTTYSLPAMLAGSYYKDEYLNYEFQLLDRVESQAKIFDFLWRDTKLGIHKPNDLPLTHYSGTPFGWMTARTGWGNESVIAEMKVNEYNFANHQHHDAGAFQIYYKGPLAIDAGLYQGTSGGYNSPHCKNFSKRTIAHNSLLIYDPKEVFASSKYGGGEESSDFVTNDGGQRLSGNGWSEVKNYEDLLSNDDFKTGKVLAQGIGSDSKSPDYSYLKGDITSAYSSKVKDVKRSFMFLNLKNEKIPAALIVFDKIVSSNPSFKKFWLLHSIEEPVIVGNKITVKRTKNGDSGKLENTVLLPELSNASIIPVGGKGKEFWVFGTNYPNEPKTNTVDEANERGAWRVEVSPKKASAEDYYLNVIQVADSSQNKLNDVKLIDADKVIGVQIADRIVTFSKNTNTIERYFSLNVEGTQTYKFVLTDMLPGTWQIMKDGKVIYPSISVRSDDKVLSFEGTSGAYKFLR